MKVKNPPLVSVFVLTFNSSKTIEETLDSIYNQTYPNIELIISDDASKDNTIKICKNWIDLHSTRFKSVKILTVQSNTGTAANLNRAERSCNNEWVKSIAGDDLLEQSCISNYVEYVQDHQDAIFVFGRVDIFGNSKSKIEYFNNFFDYNFFNLSQKQQLERLLKYGNCIPALSFFYNLKKKNEMGLSWDERVPLLEDLPMWINALQKGVKFHFIEKVTGRYRVGGTGLTSGSGSPLSLKSKRRFDILYIFNYIYEKDKEDGLNFLIKYVEGIDTLYLTSYYYKLGKLILFPFIIIRNLIRSHFS